MQFSDLHIHSVYSDGLMWPSEIAETASKSGIKYISITDHDTIDSQYNLIELSNRYNISIIPGIEFSTIYNDIEIHILGYFIDIYNQELQQMLSIIKNSREKRIKDIIDKLNDLDIDISYSDILHEGSSLGRPHIAKILVSKGYAGNTKEAFTQYLIKGKPAYVDRYKVHYKDVLKLIRNCNGVSVLAHPGEIYKGIHLEKTIKELKVYGLNGIEVFHPAHSSKQISDYYNLSKKYSLVISGGSDYHGGFSNNFSTISIGSYGLDENLTNKFLKLNLLNR
ncbi:PHP domain protein [Clostridiales bacterium oral taxon 876 str. F0540]|nr:PHP domain protein [Clostridiales bacterium oral taxon 876 str. F0540]